MDQYGFDHDTTSEGALECNLGGGRMGTVEGEKQKILLRKTKKGGPSYKWHGIGDRKIARQ